MKKDFEEKEPAFKVVDRRRFTEQGEDRQESDTKNDIVEEKKEVFKQDLKDENRKSEDSLPRPTISFSLFIQSLAHQSMMALGMVPWPDSGLVKIDLNLAKETIDILQVLKEKTVNNLTKEEEKLLESMVYQLKLAFVEISRKPIDEPNSIIT